MSKETALPKNIRQIGEIQGEERIYLEDYVVTYIQKKEQKEQEGFLGVFLGEARREGEVEYVFIRGLLELPNQEEQIAEYLEQQRQRYFPDWTVQGCCVIGQYQTDRMQAVGGAVPEAGRMIYHLQEQEENLYWTEGGRYRRLMGYFIFYEQNRRMQECLADAFQENSVEKEGLPDKAIKSFREKVKEKGEEKSRTGMLKLAGSFFAVTVLVIGALLVNRADVLRTLRGQEKESTAENEALGQITVSGTPGVAVDGKTAQEGADSSGSVEGGGAAEDALLPDSAAVSALVSRDEAHLADQTPGGSEGSASQDGDVSAGQEVSAGGGESPEAAASPSVGGESPEAAASPSVGGESPEAAASPSVGGESPEAAASSGVGGESAEISTPPAVGAESAATSAPAAEGGASFGEDAAAVSAPVRRTRASYTIREGDTLADICSKYYGNIDKLEELCEANGIDDADLILPGQKIVLP